MSNIFLSHWWPGVALWSVLYVLDFTMTMLCARLYRKGANEKVIFEGSLEITPIFQRDVDQLRIVSPRFLACLVLYGAFLAGAWMLWAQPEPELYEFFLGALVGIQLAIHVRHLRNFVMFRNLAAKDDRVKGCIEYPRPLMLRMSSIEILAFAIMFAVLAGMMQSWFLAGAAFTCGVTAWKHLRLAQKHAEESNAVRAVPAADTRTG